MSGCHLCVLCLLRWEGFLGMVGSVVSWRVAFRRMVGFLPHGGPLPWSFWIFSLIPGSGVRGPILLFDVVSFFRCFLMVFFGAFIVLSCDAARVFFLGLWLLLTTKGVLFVCQTLYTVMWLIKKAGKTNNLRHCEVNYLIKCMLL